MAYPTSVDIGTNNPSSADNGFVSHASHHQEIVGSDPLTPVHVERIGRSTKTTFNATPAMFSGVSGNADNTLQSGHRWTLSNSPSGSTAYTSDFIQGSQCIKLVSNGSSSSATVTSARETAVNLTNKMIRMWLKFDAASYANINSAFVILGSGATAFANNIQCQIAGSNMTANAEYAKPGEWVCFTFNPSSFITVSGTIDLTSIQDFRVSIKDLGAGNATILFGGIDFVPNDSAASTGLVSLTFDDGYIGQWNIAKPYMERYGYKGTFFVINDVLGTNPSLYMSQSQIDQLHLLGHEIAPHSWLAADHNIAGGFPAVATAEQMFSFGQQKQYVHQNGYRGVNGFAYPQGLYDTTLLNVVRQQFAYARTTTFRSIETLPVANPHRLRSITLAANTGVAVTPNTTPGTIEWYLDEIAANGGWLIIYSHDIVASGATGTQTNQTNFQTMLDYINTKNIPVRTIADVLGV